jgi:predicted nuclease of predicted toxin-antitoxin system
LKIKIDENLPAECATVFREAGFEAETVADEGLRGVDDSLIADRSRTEGRVLVTLDLDFGNVVAYPPAEHAGIVVLRLKAQDRRTILAVMQRIVLALVNREPAGELWIVEFDRIRFREK